LPRQDETSSPPLSGPDQARLNALVQKAQRIVTAESSQETSSLISFDSVSFDDVSVTDTIASSIPKKRGRPPKKAKKEANVINI
jgi:hypothetical protein